MSYIEPMRGGGNDEGISLRRTAEVVREYLVSLVSVVSAVGVVGEAGVVGVVYVVGVVGEVQV